MIQIRKSEQCASEEAHKTDCTCRERSPTCATFTPLTDRDRRAHVCLLNEHALRSLNGVLQPALSEQRVVVCVTGVQPPLALHLAATTDFLVW